MEVLKETQNCLELCDIKGFPCGSVGKESPAMQETPVQFLGQEDLLEMG